MKKTKKLALNAQTLRSLTHANLRKVAGGLAQTDACDTTESDTCNCQPLCNTSVGKHNDGQTSHYALNTFWVAC